MSETPVAEFACRACGAAAGRVEVRPSDAMGGRLAVVVSGFIGRAEYATGAPEQVAAAIAARDVRALYAMDVEWAPFYCPACDACYCVEHWRTWTEFDDGFYDCTRGTCPEGHTRMLDD